MTRMKKKYVEEVAPALMQKFQYKSPMQIPRIDKIVVSVGCGDCKDNAKALEAVIKDISAITGQHAVATAARTRAAHSPFRPRLAGVAPGPPTPPPLSRHQLA